MDDVKPNFDVFSLGRVLWSMISGERFLRLWYHHHPDFDLQALFPNNLAMDWAARILDKCVVEHERDCLDDTAELLAEVDQAIEALTHGAQILRKVGHCDAGFADLVHTRIKYAMTMRGSFSGATTAVTC